MLQLLLLVFTVLVALQCGCSRHHGDTSAGVLTSSRNVKYSLSVLLVGQKQALPNGTTVDAVAASAFPSKRGG
jgi:hypothetical protein